MTTEEENIFKGVLLQFAITYPNSEIKYENNMCSASVFNTLKGIKNRKAFCTEGYNLLYCITQLAELLKEKLV